MGSFTTPRANRVLCLVALSRSPRAPPVMPRGVAGRRPAVKIARTIPYTAQTYRQTARRMNKPDAAFGRLSSRRWVGRHDVDAAGTQIA